VLLSIAFFVFLLWRMRREEIAVWPGRARFAIYGGALLIVAALGVFFLRGVSGPNALALILVIGLSGFAMWRVWRDQETYGYSSHSATSSGRAVFANHSSVK
jgi:Na+/melibiose symporter-like transporter